MAEYVRVKVDRVNKMIKAEWIGKPDYTGIEEGCKLVNSEIASFKKGEALVLVDVRNVDMRFLPPGADKLLQDSYVYTITNSRKLTNVVSSIMLEKQLEKSSSAGNSLSNFRIFDSEQEAIKWLLE